MNEIDIVKGKYEVLRLEVKKFGTSGHITIPKKYIGKKVTIIIENEI